MVIEEMMGEQKRVDDCKRSGEATVSQMNRRGRKDAVHSPMAGVVPDAVLILVARRLYLPVEMSPRREKGSTPGRFREP